MKKLFINILLSDPVSLATKKVVREIVDKELLLKCIHEQTQNPYESLNNLYMGKGSQSASFGVDTLKIGVMGAVLRFNNGAYICTEIHKILGVIPRTNTCLR